MSIETFTIPGTVNPKESARDTYLRAHRVSQDRHTAGERAGRFKKMDENESYVDDIHPKGQMIGKKVAELMSSHLSPVDLDAEHRIASSDEFYASDNEWNLGTLEAEEQDPDQDLYDLIEELEDTFDLSTLTRDDLRAILIARHNQRVERYASVGLNPVGPSTGHGTKKDFAIDGSHGDDEDISDNPSWRTAGFITTDRP